MEIIEIIVLILLIWNFFGHIHYKYENKQLKEINKINDELLDSKDNLISIQRTRLELQEQLIKILEERMMESDIQKNFNKINPN